MATTLTHDRHVFLDAVLTPHRSLPIKGFRTMMLGLGLLSVGVGVGSVLAGAWPIVGFFGLDVLLIYVAFRLSYRAARLRECVRLTEETFTVERVSPHGMRSSWRFEPYWLRVRFNEDAEKSTLTIGSHGKTVVLGAFLGAEAKRSFAAQLTDALRNWHSFIASRGAQ